MLRFVLTLLLACTAASALASQVETTEVDGEKVTRVGGTYVVKAIERKSPRLFVITFEAETKSGRFDVLELTSDHVHVAIRTGQTLRLSAEILSEKEAWAEVAQVLVFLPSTTGNLPVWLLSNKAPRRDLRGTRYLEMHAPSNDFTVM